MAGSHVEYICSTVRESSNSAKGHSNKSVSQLDDFRQYAYYTLSAAMAAHQNLIHIICVVLYIFLLQGVSLPLHIMIFPLGVRKPKN